MKKSILVAAIALLSSPALMAEEQMKTMVLDSMIYEGAGGASKIEYTWNEYGNQTSETNYNWDEGTSAWIPSGRISWTYNADGNMSSKLYQYYDTKWVNDQQYTIKYDEGGNVVEEKVQHWNIGTEVWENSQWMKYIYDGYGHKITYLNGGWDVDKWVFYDKTDYSYNEQGLLEIEVSSYLNTVTGDYNLSGRSTYKYDAAGHEIETIYCTWDSGDWKPYNKETNTYDADDNLKEYAIWSINSLGTDWDPVTKYTYSYNTENQLISLVLENYSTAESKFVPSYKYEYAYNAFGYLESEKQANWNGSDWAYSYKRETMYIEGTDYVKKELDYDWEVGKDMFVNKGIGTYYYHETTTSLENRTAGAKSTIKVLRNGQLLIMSNGATYNMQGARVE